MKFVFGVAVLVTIVALTAATKGKHGKGKTNVVVVDAYPERRPVYDYPAPRPSYAYQPTYAEYVEVPVKIKSKKHKKAKKQKVTIVQARPVYENYGYGSSYNNYDDYVVVPKVKKTKHVEKTYRQYREPVYYDAPKKERPITSVLVLITDLHIKVVNQTPKKVKEAYPAVYRDRIQKVPVYQHVPYPVYIQPQRHYAPPRKSLKRVYYHSPKQVYHHPPRPVYQQARPYGR
nr:adhesive plaque matrix protein-like isoform X14 [Rhipicephalus microplus]